jgi:glycosyltransferase involved in cell wall biosynthesis
MSFIPLRIAFVSPRYPVGETVGGAETLLAALARHAALMGHHVEFFTTCARDHFTWSNEHKPGTRVLDGVPVTFFPVNEDRDIDAFLRAQASISSGRDVDGATQISWLRNGVNSRAMEAHLRESAGRFDKIVVGPYLFGLTHSTAAVAPERTLLLPCLHDEAFARLDCFREMFRSVAGHIFNTEPERQLAERLYSITPGAETVVGIGLDPFTADSAAFAARKGIRTPYVLYCGRREPLKGTPLLVDYFSCFVDRTKRPLSLVLTGSGPVSIPTSMHGRIMDAGFLPAEQKHEAMAGAVAFVHPSVNESLSIVLLESWMVGVPAIVHAMSKVLVYQCGTGGGGLWFSSYPEFEETMCLLLDRADIREMMGQRGRQYVRSMYDWKSVGQRLDKALRL